jgi:hypothetical protein
MEKTMRRLWLAAVALLMAMPVLAQEPVGCDKFKWPLDKERALLAAATAASSGSEAKPIDTAVKIALLPYADAKLPVTPERVPKSPDSNAGYLRVSGVPKAGTYRITLSEGAWIEVIENGHAVKSAAFSGATGCDGVRKSVKFELSGGPFIIELSGTKAQSVGVVVTRD